MMDVFALMARAADIRRALALYNSIKAPLTELIDLTRSIAGDAGLLGKAPSNVPATVPPALRKYDTKWIQAALNKLGVASLRVDGDLGGENSETRAAVRKFQEAHPPLAVDGNPGVQTVSVLQQELDRLDQT